MERTPAALALVKSAHPTLTDSNQVTQTARRLIPPGCSVNGGRRGSPGPSVLLGPGLPRRPPFTEQPGGGESTAVIEAGGQTKRYSAATARQPSFRVPRRPPGRRDAVVGAGTVVVATGTLSRGESGPGPARPAIATPPTASAAPSGTSSPPAPPPQGQTPSLALPAPAPNSSTPAAGPSRGA